jgi:ectoine hydroxylase-related dioxygenase (phytanoyl-CoA dioxygenase family)
MVMAEPAPVSAAQVRTFRTQGVVTVDFIKVIGSELWQRLLDACAEVERTTPRVQGATRIGGGDLRLKIPAIDAVARSPRVGEMVRMLCGAEHVRIWLDAYEALYPGFPGTSVHQDLPNYPLDRRGLVTVIVALEEVTPEMGVNQFLPGSHRLGPFGCRTVYDASRTRENPVKPREEFMALLREDEREVVGEVICQTQHAGTAVIHDGLIFHASGLNLSDRVYRRASFVYFPADAKYTCVPYPTTDGLGLEPFKPLEHERFPLVA